MYYYQDKQNRETRITKNFITLFAHSLLNLLEISKPSLIIVELCKKRYGKKGDVDIAIAVISSNNINPELINIDYTIAIEVKVSVLDENNNWHSLKHGKHIKQIVNNKSDGWDYNYLFDFVITKPQATWFHNQVWKVHDDFMKEVEICGCGHILAGKYGVIGKEDEDAGSISGPQLISKAQRNKEKGLRDKIIEVFLNSLKEINIFDLKLLTILHDDGTKFNCLV